jgi:serine phosphatase RsbU (regulator of sigma subunit)
VKLHRYLLLFFVFSLGVTAQDFKEIDSLRKILPKISDDDTMKVKIYAELSFQVSYLNLDSGLILALHGVELAKKQNYERGKAYMYNVIGTIYYDKADYKNSISYLTDARRIMEKLGDPSSLAAIYANSSNTHLALKDYASARHALYECLRICKENNFERTFVPTYIALGSLYYEMNNNDSALYFFDEALKLKATDKGYLGALHASRAMCFRSMNRYSDSEKEYKIAIDIAKELRSDYYIYEYSGGLGRLYALQKRYKEAEALLMSSLNYFKNSSLKKEEIVGYLFLYELYKAQNKPDKALYYHERYFQLNDSINNAETNKIARELEKKYEDQKKIAQIEKLNAENIAGESENERKGQLLIFAVIACVLVAIGLGFAIYAFVNKRKANIELHVLHKAVSDQKNELFEKNKNITDSILYAQRIQRALLSSRAYIKENVNDFFIIHKPKDIVSGDFYWAQRSGEDLFFMLADCTGHGVPGAFMSLLGISYLNELVVGQKNKDTDKILNGLRSNIIQALTDSTYEMKDGMDGVLCRFNFKKTHLQYSAANNGIVIIRDKTIIELNGDKMPIGRSPRDTENFTAHEFELRKNDMIYLFTDGFPDQFGGPKGKKLKTRSLKETLLKWHELPLKKQENSLSSYFEEWKNDLEQIDDVTLVGFRV